jgi:GH24 family phage-related lysozyme (muramidase)
VAIKKVQGKCDKLKQFVLDLEEENEAANRQIPRPLTNSKFRKVIDQVFGEKPKRRKPGN